MSTVTVRIPEYIHKRLRAMSKRENASINQLITLAVAEKLSAIETMDYLEERAARADRAAFEAVLDKVPDVPPAAGDELP
jgi:hypothetical protein